MEATKGKKMAESQKKVQTSLEEYVKTVQKPVWQTEDGKKQLQTVIDYLQNNQMSKSICIQWLKNECGWTLSNRRIRDIIDMHLGENWTGY